MTRNQKRARFIGGVIVSLVSGGIIGGALASATDLVFMPALVGIVVCGYAASLYFSGPST